VKTMAIISGHPGAGQTTLAVNLASGLVQKGYRVLIGTLGENHKLYYYLGIDAKQESALDSRDTQNHLIQSSRLGMDLLVFMPGPDKSANSPMLLPIMGNTDYDYLLLIPATKADCSQLGNLFEHLLICMDFSCAKEVEELIALEKYLQGLSENPKAISLIIPNKMNSKEWAHNSQQLFALADYFETERIADPIPFCERIHDLPQQGRTVWQLSQQNLRDAFHRLMEAVELL
jgi:cellulose biosynthesis protein BcsQ